MSPISAQALADPACTTQARRIAEQFVGTDGAASAADTVERVLARTQPAGVVADAAS